MDLFEVHVWLWFQLFDYIAQCIFDFMTEHKLLKTATKLPLGFTFRWNILHKVCAVVERWLVQNCSHTWRFPFLERKKQGFGFFCHNFTFCCAGWFKTWKYFKVLKIGIMESVQNWRPALVSLWWTCWSSGHSRILQRSSDVCFVQEKRKQFSIACCCSFPCAQDGLNVGRLVRWTKGFKCAGVEGEDVVKLLHDAIQRRGVRMLKFSGVWMQKVVSVQKLLHLMEDNFLLGKWHNFVVCATVD